MIYDLSFYRYLSLSLSLSRLSSLLSPLSHYRVTVTLQSLPVSPPPRLTRPIHISLYPYIPIPTSGSDRLLVRS